MPVKIVPIPVLTQQQISNFEAKIERSDAEGCWTWTGCRMNNGYGQVRLKNKAYLAHRVAYSVYVGEIPEGMQILHACDNGHRGCVAPHHLRPGTQAENQRQMAATGKRKGERHHLAKLTDDDVRAIRAEYVPRVVTQRFLAKKYGVSHAAIGLIVLGKNWPHID